MWIDANNDGVRPELERYCVAVILQPKNAGLRCYVSRPLTCVIETNFLERTWVVRNVDVLLLRAEGMSSSPNEHGGTRTCLPGVGVPPGKPYESPRLMSGLERVRQALHMWFSERLLKVSIWWLME